jgi:hypothetical protein
MLNFFFNFKNFRRKNWRFLAQTTAKFCKNVIITLVFENNADFLPKIGKNRRKL